ncbi:MAG: hypothetical protein KBT27_12195, partial [Prevotellaceae bacterium]|nr:hypothetical protein [Candidatus Faecinaster equi]
MDKTIKTHYDIKRMLDECDLLNALNQIKTYAYEVNKWELISQTDILIDDYKRMLNVMTEGFVDENRDDFFENLIFRAYTINDLLLIEIGKDKVGDEYYTALQTTSNSNLANNLLQLEQLQQQALFNAITDEDNFKYTKEHLDLLDNTFNIIWTMGKCSSKNKETLRNILLSSTINKDDRRHLVSALVLSCLYVFDINKIDVIIDCIKDEEKTLFSKATLGLVFIALTNEKGVAKYIKSLKSVINDNIFINTLTKIQILLLQSCNIDEIHKTFETNIIPTIIKHKDELNGISPEKLQDMLEDSDVFSEEEEEKISDSIKKITNLQQQGADIYWSMFKNMKHTPFFNRTSHWFVPYNQQKALLFNPSSHDHSAIASFVRHNPLCHSDKYSLYYMLDFMGGSQMEMLEKQLGEMFKNDIYDADDDTNTPSVLNLDFQDYYRFFILKCHIFNNLYNPFDKSKYIPLLIGNKLFDELLINDEILQKICETAYHFKQYDYCIKTYSSIFDKNQLAEHINIISGHSAEKCQNYKLAIFCYEQALCLNNKSELALLRLTKCYNQIHDQNKTDYYYNLLLQYYPDNKNYIYKYIKFLYNKKDYKKALDLAFKLDYLCPNNTSIQRYIMMCAIKSNKIDTAENYYQKTIQSNDIQTSDILIGGHLAWIQGDIKRAVERYKQLKGYPTADLGDLFNENNDVLLNNNINRYSIQCM